MIQLTRGLRAYFQFQDILDVSVDDTSPLVNRHYCYYESLAYLRESVTSWLDRNVLSCLTSLRPFLELAVFHCYWHLRCAPSSYQPYYNWLGGSSGKPPFTAALKYVFENMPAADHVDRKRLGELQASCTTLYKSLCAYNHTPRLDESIVTVSGGPGTVALEIFLYAVHMINFVLREIVYLFILAYPMSLFPVDRCSKWGFSGPLGLFFDQSNFKILQHYLRQDNVSRLQASLRSMPEVESLLAWYHEQATLSAEEVAADWARFRESTRIADPTGAASEPTLLTARLAAAKASARATSWALNYMPDKLARDTIPDSAVSTLWARILNW